MKRLMMWLCAALSIAAGLEADEPTVVAMRTKVHGLPANVRIIVEMRARYSVIDVARLAGRKAGNEPVAPDTLYAVLSSDLFRWDFTTDARGQAPPKEFRFHFPKRLRNPPEGLDGILGFQTKYRIVCPQGVCRSRESSPEFMTDFEATPVVQRCLELYFSEGVGIGVNEDCGGFSGKRYKRFPSR